MTNLHRFYDTAVGIHEGRTNFFLELPDGDYLVTLQMGWNAEQVQSIVWFQDEEISSANEIVAKGDSHVIRKSVSVTNGNLNLEFLRTNGFSTYLNWMAIERREAVGEVTWNHFLAPPADTSEAKKRSSLHGRRSSYSGITISSISSARSEHSLNGDWLFLPLQEMIEGPKPWLPQADDSNWHVMDVPKFWTPLYAWTYMDEDQGRGSANWVERENTRCESYTFDYETTSVAFYKKHVTLPLDITGRTCFLTFDAIGKDAEVWVNGLPAGVHSGMFSAAKFDVTSFVRPGENIIVVKAGEFTDFDITNDFLPGVAERRPIEKKTSQNYPNGMLFGRNLGIWQGVMLTFSDDITIEDTFFRPGLNKYDLSVTVANRGASSTPYSLASQIRSFEDNRLIYDSYSFSRKFGLTMTSSSVQKFELFDNPLGHIPFRNWSPESPNLYKVDIFAYRYNQDPTVSLSEFSSPILKLNFQPADFPTPLGWTAAGGDLYNPTTGFGWNSVEETRVRSNATNPLSDTLITFYRDTEAIFSCDVPNGEYVLTMQFGDKEYPSLAEAYVGDDTSNLDAVIVRDAMDMNSFRIVLKSITVENGQLMITIPSMPDPAIGTSLNWLVLEPRSAVTAAKWVSMNCRF
jgi:Glycosyl hydrolases family 2, sugar binding domain